jgi:lysophospholipase L1-like esterase
VPSVTPRLLTRSLAVATAMLVGVEGGTRLDDWVRFGTPLTARPIGMADLLIRDSLGVHGRPSVHFRKWRMNGLGMRGEEPRHGESVGAARVLVAGASETFGLLESPGAEWPAQLQRELSARCGPERPDVLNAAFAGMSLPTITQDLARRGAQLAPQWFVYYPTPAQFLEIERPVAAERDTVTPRGNELPVFDWRFISRFRDQLRDALPVVVRQRYYEREIAMARAGQPDDWLFHAPPVERLAAFEADLRTLVGVAHGAGAKVVLVQHATYVDGPPPKGPRDADFRVVWNRFYPRATIDALIATEAAAAEIVRRIAADSGARVVDVRSSLHRDRDRLFSDQSHLSDAGAAVVAQGVASILEAGGVCVKRTIPASPLP